MLLMAALVIAGMAPGARPTALSPEVGQGIEYAGSATTAAI
jgi:hypothetical protein